MKRRIKLVEVISTVPYPVRAGGTQALFNMINGLREYIDITVVLNMPKGKEQDLADLMALWPNVKFLIFRKKRDVSYYIMKLCQVRFLDYMLGDRRLRSLRIPISTYTPDWLSFVQSAIHDTHPDIVQTEFYGGQDLIYAFPHDVRTIFIQHEIHYVVNKLWLKANGCWDIGAAQIAYYHMRAEELAAMNCYDVVLTLNEADKAQLIKDGVTSLIYSSPVSVMAAPYRNKCHFSDKLVFVGAGGHPPNVEGVHWFVKFIWPSIIRKYPNIQFHVVGQWSESQVNLFKHERNVYFDGFVPSLQEVFDGGIAVVPIISGSGIRMKILDAVNFGMPFISTELGALGMGFEDGRDCFIATSAQDFIDKLIALIESETLRQQFYINSYKVYEELYSQQAVINRRLSIYQEILKNKSI